MFLRSEIQHLKGTLGSNGDPYFCDFSSKLVFEMTFQSVIFSTLDIEYIINKLFSMPSFQACISSSWK